MEGYSKMKIIHSPFPSRSTELNSDQFPSFRKHTDSVKTAYNREPSPPELQESGHREIKKHGKSENQNISDAGFKEGEESVFESSYLTANPRRNSSFSPASDNLNEAVMRAFSMKRSSSVVDRYSRLRYESPTNDSDGFLNNSRSIKKMNTRGRILKACKKFIGM